MIQKDQCSLKKFRVRLYGCKLYVKEHVTFPSASLRRCRGHVPILLNKNPVYPQKFGISANI